NNRDRNFTQGKLDRRRQQIEESVSRYLSQLDTADRQDPTPELAAKVVRLKEKIARLGQEMERLAGLEEQMKAAPDRQISLTDPDARSMATSGRGSGLVGYNVQVAVETEHHLIVSHAVTNAGSDRAQLSGMAARAKQALETDTLDAVADRGYYSGEQILACERAGISVTLPRPMTSGAKAAGRFGKEDFLYRPPQNVYLCPAGETLPHRCTTVENGLTLHRYWTNACSACPMKAACTTGKERRVTRWEHEDVLETVQRRLDADPLAMRVRRETVEHPFGTLKARMGATHFLTKTLPRVSTEMALQVLAYNLTR
ncbi:transposase, partial [Methylobacterium sp. WL9]